MDSSIYYQYNDGNYNSIGGGGASPTKCSMHSSISAGLAYSGDANSGRSVTSGEPPPPPPPRPAKRGRAIPWTALTSYAVCTSLLRSPLRVYKHLKRKQRARFASSVAAPPRRRRGSANRRGAAPRSPRRPRGAHCARGKSAVHKGIYTSFRAPGRGRPARRPGAHESSRARESDAPRGRLLARGRLGGRRIIGCFKRRIIIEAPK